MWRWFARRSRERRAKRYLQTHPEDDPAVQTILFTLDHLCPKSARDVAQMTAGRKLSEAEWISFAPRWERAWAAIVSPTKISN
jgi:hypothetical protein